MEGRAFFDRIQAHPELEWLGVREADRSPGSFGDEVLVRHATTGVKYALAVTAVTEHPWQELEAVLTGARPALLVTHLTRIVGYFSRVQNWNRSKLAELRDRRAGSYALPDAGGLKAGSAERPAASRQAAPVGFHERLAAVA